MRNFRGKYVVGRSTYLDPVWARSWAWRLISRVKTREHHAHCSVSGWSCFICADSSWRRSNSFAQSATGHTHCSGTCIALIGFQRSKRLKGTSDAVDELLEESERLSATLHTEEQLSYIVVDIRMQYCNSLNHLNKFGNVFCTAMHDLPSE